MSATRKKATAALRSAKRAGGLAPDWDKVSAGMEKLFPTLFGKKDATPRIPTRFMRLDFVLGGGLPCGRIVQVVGPEMSYKTTLALTLAADVQKHSPKCVLYLDHEYAVDLDYARRLGVDTSKGRWLLVQPDYMEQGFDFACEFIKTGACSMVVVDSIAALAPKAMMEKHIEANFVGLLPRKLGQALTVMTPVLKEHAVPLLALNQVRVKISGVPGAKGWSPPGGKCLQHLTSVRIHTGISFGRDMERGVVLRFKKNKMTGWSEFLSYRETPDGEVGLDLSDELLQLGKMVKPPVVEVAGGWYKFAGKKEAKIQGREKAAEHARKRGVARVILRRAGLLKKEVEGEG